MNDLGKFDTPEEIKDAILTRLGAFKTIRTASINTDCMDEAMLFNVLAELANAGIITYDSTFITLI